MDAAGNTEAAESDSFKIDSVKPVTTDSLSGTQGSNGWYTSASVSVTLTPSDATSGVVATYYTIDGGSQQTYTGSPFSVAGDGSHQITFWSVDAAGNTEAPESASVNIDTVKPATTDNLSNTGWYTSASVSVTLTASDATSGVAATYYTIDGGSQQTYSGSAFSVTGEGSHRIVFWSVDMAGNTEVAESGSFQIDSVKPHTTDSLSGVQGTNGWYTSASVGVTLTASDATSGVAATCYAIDGGSQQTYTGSPFSVTGEGSHRIVFWSVDAAGNTEAVESANINIDSVKPHTTDSLSGTQGSNGWYTSASVGVTLTASDATSGVAATYYTIDGGSQQTYSGSAFSVTGAGTHQVAFWSVDMAGNTEAAESVSIQIDNVKPHTTDSLSGALGSNSWYTSPSVGVTLTASNAVSGVAATYYTIDGGSRQTYSGSAFSVTGEGSHQITFWSVDEAGNTESAELDSFKIDSVKPHTTDSLSGAQAGNGSYISASVGVTLTASDAGSGVAATYYTIDGGSRQTYSGSAFSVAGNGSHQIAFWSVDAAGNTEAAESASFTIEPVSLSQSTFVAAPASVPAGGQSTITLTVVDAAGDRLSGQSVAFGLAPGGVGGALGAVTDHGDGTYSATFTAGTTPGTTTLTAAINGQAVTSTAPAVTVTAGPVSLSQSTISLTAANLIAGSTATVTVTAKDAYGNPEPAGLPITFGLGSGSGSGTFSSVTYSSGGLYQATFTATTYGSNSITAAVNGQAITSTAPTFNVPIGPTGQVANDRPFFTWPVATGASGYDLYVLDQAPGQTPVFLQNLTGTSIQLTGSQAPTPGHTYTWYYGDIGAGGAIAWSKGMIFSVAPLTAPTPSGPLNVTLAPSSGFDTPTFSWSNVAAADQYYLYVADNLTPKQPLIANSSITGTSFTPSASEALTPGHSYTWYIGAESANGQAMAWSGPAALSLAALAQPTLHGPQRNHRAPAAQRPLAGTRSRARITITSIYSTTPTTRPAHC